MTPLRYLVTWTTRDGNTPRAVTVLAVDGDAALRGTIRWEDRQDGGQARNIRVSLAIDEAPVLAAERARYVWERRPRGFTGLMGGGGDALHAALTPDEERAVMERWAAMPGHTCWMDAFHPIRMDRPAPFLL